MQPAANFVKLERSSPGACMGGSAAQAGAREASNPRPGVRVLRPGAWWVGSPRTKNPPGIGDPHSGPGAGEARPTPGMAHAPPGPIGPFPAPPPGLCPVTKTGAHCLEPPPPNSRRRPSRQPLLNFSRRGRAGHAVPMAPGRSGYSPGNPQTPLALRHTSPRSPASSPAFGSWGGGSEPPRGPQPSNPDLKLWEENCGEGEHRGNSGGFQNVGPKIQMGGARLCTGVCACLYGHPTSLLPLCLSLSVCPGVLGYYPRGRYRN